MRWTIIVAAPSYRPCVELGRGAQGAGGRWLSCCPYEYLPARTSPTPRPLRPAPYAESSLPQHENRDPQRHEQRRHDPAEHSLGDPAEQELSRQRAGEDAAAGDGDDRPRREELAAGGDGVDREACAVDDQGDGDGGGDEDFLAHVEREHRR